jgi:hypothetical protein
MEQVVQLFLLTGVSFFLGSFVERNYSIILSKLDKDKYTTCGTCGGLIPIEEKEDEPKLQD